LWTFVPLVVSAFFDSNEEGVFREADKPNTRPAPTRNAGPGTSARVACILQFV
jgi:hypothetical protein